MSYRWYTQHTKYWVQSFSRNEVLDMSYAFVSSWIKVALIFFLSWGKELFSFSYIRWDIDESSCACFYPLCGRLLVLRLNQNAYFCRKGLWWFLSVRCEGCFLLLILNCTLKCSSSNGWKEILGINLNNCTKYCFLRRYLPCCLKCSWSVSLAWVCCLFHLEMTRQGNARWHTADCVGFFVKKRSWMYDS